MFQTNVSNLLNENNIKSKIISSSKSLDDCLGGGFPVGHITEICGTPGSGKTQMCLQLCVNVQIPECLGGLNGKAIYIDTIGGFIPTRFTEIANSSASIINRILLNNKSKLKLDTTINTETIKSNTFVFYANTLNLFKAAVNQLKLELQRQPQISLIVIDSFSYHLKAMNNSFARMNLIYDMLSSLQALIVNKKIAVVITNEMTTALFTDKNTNETKSKIVPSLGESFAHKINQRIIFQSDNKPGYFRAKIAKSLLKSTGYCNFIVTSSGVK